MKQQDFVYSNHMDRPVNVWLRTGAVVHPGLRRVQAQIKPYADAWIAANLRSLSRSGPLWIAMGDSMTQGVGASRPDRGWVGQLRDMLAEHGQTYRLVNLSVSGDRIADLTAKQLTAAQKLETPALTTILIGANDTFRKKYRQSLPEAMANMLQNVPAGAYIGNLPNRRGNPDIQAANQVLHEEARRRGLHVVDTSSAFQPPFRTKLAEDYFHPNDQGYNGIARVFADSILANQTALARQP